MHNGTVFGFEKIRRLLRRGLSDEAYNLIKGNTDTEHIFALFIDLIKPLKSPTAEQLANALMGAIRKIETLKDQVGLETPSSLNLVISDGQSMVATRYVSSGEGANSLYILTGSQLSCEDGQCSMDEGSNAVLVVSEPLSNSPRWQKIGNNHLITVDRDRNISVQSM